MKCIVTEKRVMTRDNQVGYIVINAIGQQGDDTATALTADGYINPLACLSRTTRFTKTLFPATEAQLQSLDEAIVEGVSQVMLKLITKPSEQPFVMKRGDGSYYEEEVEEEVNGKIRVISKKRVFNTVNLVVFCDEEERCVEGDEEDLLNRAWTNGVSRGIYVPF